MTKHQIMTLLFSAGTSRIMVDGIIGIFQSIEREDGSGKCFNIRIREDNGRTTTVCVKTID